MPAQIPFTRGVPSADILPVAELREAASAALEREPALALSYSSGAGHPGLRSWIAGIHAQGQVVRREHGPKKKAV